MKRESDFRIYGRLLRQARPWWLCLAASFLLRLLATPLTLLIPLPLKIAIDSVIGAHPLPGFLASILPASLQMSPGNLTIVVAALIVLIALLIASQALAVWLLDTYTGESLVLDFRAELFRHVQRLSLSYHDMKGASDSTYRIQYDAAAIQLIIVNGVIPLVTAVVSLAAMMYVTLRLDWQLAMVSLGISPVLFFITREFGPPLREGWKKLKKLDSSAMSVVQEVLSSVRVVKAFGTEEREHARFLRQSSHRMWEQLRMARLQGGFDVIVAGLIALGTAITMIIGIQHCRAGALTIGGLLVIMAYQAQLYEPLKTLSKKAADLQSGLASAERAFALLDELPEVIERPDAVSVQRVRGKLEFRNVTFSYDDPAPVLDNISFTISPGSRVGIQGTTGAGKTTLASLLMRFYDPVAGAILLDDVDVRDYRLVDLRSQFGLVLQDTVLFSRSIGENISYARPGASEKDVRQAAKLANAHDFIMRLPDGYDTRVGERGMRLSGGERQRISLARAFLKDAPILFYEPTSSVDIRTETSIMEAIERLMRTRTTFLIAHRLSTLENCDVRLEIEQGRIREVASVTPREAHV